MYRSSYVGVVPIIDVGAFFNQCLHLQKKKVLRKKDQTSHNKKKKAKSGSQDRSPPPKNLIFWKHNRKKHQFFFKLSISPTNVCYQAQKKINANLVNITYRSLLNKEPKKGFLPSTNKKANLVNIIAHKIYFSHKIKKKEANLVNIIALGSLPQLCIQPHKRPQKARFRSKRPRLRRYNTYSILNFCENVWS